MKSEEELNQLKENLESYLLDYHGLNDYKKAFTCFSADHIDNNPSMHFSRKYNICKCFGCGISYDIFDIVGIDYNLSSFKDQVEKVEYLYGKEINHTYKKENNYIYESLKDYSNYYDECHLQITSSNYLSNRNISNRLISKYNIGYDTKKEFVIFPISKNSYFARSVSKNFKYKTKGADSILWNEDLLKASHKNDLVFITEGIIDSLSLEEIIPEMKTVSLNGNTNSSRLIKVLRENNYKGYIFLALDNDANGIKTKDHIKDMLREMNIKVFAINIVEKISKEYKDLNEALIKDRKRFENVISEYYYLIKQAIEKDSAMEL